MTMEEAFYKIMSTLTCDAILPLLRDTENPKKNRETFAKEMTPAQIGEA